MRQFIRKTINQKLKRRNLSSPQPALSPQVPPRQSLPTRCFWLRNWKPACGWVSLRPKACGIGDMHPRMHRSYFRNDDISYLSFSDEVTPFQNRSGHIGKPKIGMGLRKRYDVSVCPCIQSDDRYFILHRGKRPALILYHFEVSQHPSARKCRNTKDFGKSFSAKKRRRMGGNSPAGSRICKIEPVVGDSTP